MKKNSLSVVLAAHNEEKNIEMCLSSVKNIANEIIVVDEYSTDNTVKIAEKYGAKIYRKLWKKNFHENKQFGIEKATGDWILQLDADEVATEALANEIEQVILMSNEQLVARRSETEKQNKLFLIHQRLIEEREGHLGKQTGEIVAFFIPRLNYFLGKPMKHAGKYPDGVIRLFKRGHARLPAKSVHELPEVDGEVGWIENDLEHHEYPDLKSYINRMNRYTDIEAGELKQKKVPKNAWNLFKHSFLSPITYFLSLFFRHSGWKDGMHGFLWSILSAMHFPIAYYKYYQMKND